MATEPGDDESPENEPTFDAMVRRPFLEGLTMTRIDAIMPMFQRAYNNINELMGPPPKPFYAYGEYEANDPTETINRMREINANEMAFLTREMARDPKLRSFVIDTGKTRVTASMLDAYPLGGGQVVSKEIVETYLTMILARIARRKEYLLVTGDMQQSIATEQELLRDPESPENMLDIEGTTFHLWPIQRSPMNPAANSWSFVLVEWRTGQCVIYGDLPADSHMATVAVDRLLAYVKARHGPLIRAALGEGIDLPELTVRHRQARTWPSYEFAASILLLKMYICMLDHYGTGMDGIDAVVFVERNPKLMQMQIKLDILTNAVYPERAPLILRARTVAPHNKRFRKPAPVPPPSAPAPSSSAPPPPPPPPPDSNAWKPPSLDDSLEMRLREFNRVFPGEAPSLDMYVGEDVRELYRDAMIGLLDYMRNATKKAFPDVEVKPLNHVTLYQWEIWQPENARGNRQLAMDQLQTVNWILTTQFRQAHYRTLVPLRDLGELDDPQDADELNAVRDIGKFRLYLIVSRFSTVLRQMVENFPRVFETDPYQVSIFKQLANRLFASWNQAVEQIREGMLYDCTPERKQGYLKLAAQDPADDAKSNLGEGEPEFLKILRLLQVAKVEPPQQEDVRHVLQAMDEVVLGMTRLEEVYEPLKSMMLPATLLAAHPSTPESTVSTEAPSAAVEVPASEYDDLPELEEVNPEPAPRLSQPPPAYVEVADIDARQAYEEEAQRIWKAEASQKEKEWKARVKAVKDDPRVEHVLKNMKKYFTPTLTQSHIGGSTGELRPGGIQEGLISLGLGEGSGTGKGFVLTDMGSGWGVPLITAATMYPELTCYGVEINPQPWRASLKHLLDVYKDQPQLAKRILMFHGDAMTLPDLGPTTHLYMFNAVFGDVVQPHVARLINNAKHLKYFISNRTLGQLYYTDGLTVPVRKVRQFSAQMTVSGQSFTMYVYKLVNNPEPSPLGNTYWNLTEQPGPANKQFLLERPYGPTYREGCRLRLDPDDAKYRQWIVDQIHAADGTAVKLAAAAASAASAPQEEVTLRRGQRVREKRVPVNVANPDDKDKAVEAAVKERERKRAEEGRRSGPEVTYLTPDAFPNRPVPALVPEWQTGPRDEYVPEGGAPSPARVEAPVIPIQVPGEGFRVQIFEADVPPRTVNAAHAAVPDSPLNEGGYFVEEEEDDGTSRKSTSESDDETSRTATTRRSSSDSDDEGPAPGGAGGAAGNAPNNDDYDTEDDGGDEYTSVAGTRERFAGGAVGRGLQEVEPSGGPRDIAAKQVSEEDVLVQRLEKQREGVQREMGDLTVLDQMIQEKMRVFHEKMTVCVRKFDGMHEKVKEYVGVMNRLDQEWSKAQDTFATDEALQVEEAAKMETRLVDASLVKSRAEASAMPEKCSEEIGLLTTEVETFRTEISRDYERVIAKSRMVNTLKEQFLNELEAFELRYEKEDENAKSWVSGMMLSEMPKAEAMLLKERKENIEQVSVEQLRAFKHQYEGICMDVQTSNGVYEKLKKAVETAKAQAEPQVPAEGLSERMKRAARAAARATVQAAQVVTEKVKAVSKRGKQPEVVEEEVDEASVFTRAEVEAGLKAMYREYERKHDNLFQQIDDAVAQLEALSKRRGNAVNQANPVFDHVAEASKDMKSTAATRTKMSAVQIRENYNELLEFYKGRKAAYDKFETKEIPLYDKVLKAVEDEKAGKRRLVEVAGQVQAEIVNLVDTFSAVHPTQSHWTKAFDDKEVTAARESWWKKKNDAKRKAARMLKEVNAMEVAPSETEDITLENRDEALKQMKVFKTSLEKFRNMLQLEDEREEPKSLPETNDEYAPEEEAPPPPSETKGKPKVVFMDPPEEKPKAKSKAQPKPKAKAEAAPPPPAEAPQPPEGARRSGRERKPVNRLGFS
jgi:hypothetical protein